MTTPTTEARDDLVLLRNGTPVKRKFYEAIYRQILAKVPLLPIGGVHVAANVCGRSFWGGLTDGERRLAGQVVLDLVEAGLVPLVRERWAHEYPLKYRRI